MLASLAAHEYVGGQDCARVDDSECVRALIILKNYEQPQ